MHDKTRFFDDIAGIASQAAGTMFDLKRELEHMIAAKVETMLARTQLATRDEVDALHTRIAALEAELEALRKP